MNSLTGPNNTYTNLRQQYKDRLSRYSDKQQDRAMQLRERSDTRRMQKRDRASMLRGGGENEMIPEGYRKGTLQQFTPEQMELLQHLLSQIGPDSYLSRLGLGDEELFEEME